MYITSFNVFYNIFTTLRKNCPYLELFCFVFSRIWTETERYSASLRIQSECGKIQTRITPNTNTFFAVLITAIFHSAVVPRAISYSSAICVSQWKIVVRFMGPSWDTSTLSRDFHFDGVALEIYYGSKHFSDHRRVWLANLLH